MEQLTISEKITRADCDSVSKYLSEISRELLLTPEEETALVKRIRSGDQMAKEKLIKANLRFVVSVAKQYQNGPVPLSDLINEGNIGLMKAAERFDETRGFKFISYAVWWIRQCILAALDDQSRLIKMPSNKLASMSKIRKATDNWEKRNNNAPTPSELAQEIDMNEEEIREITSSFSTTTSLDSPYGKNGESLMSEFISGDVKEDDEQPIDVEQLKKVIHSVLSNLERREREIIEMSFGINQSMVNSLDEISERLGISRERVRQVKEKALKKLSYRGVRNKIKALALA